ncbi:MAG: hypothetical protein QY320_00715 [Gammaproteobacteria bacterium]|nr:MAG: hypothetical protein QY320_00715 [Gammaproteobacteria bacterium]
MPRRKRDHPDHRRSAIAQEAARLMQEHGVTSFRGAKEKAGQRLGLQDHGALPSNAEIDSALAERHRIFAGDSHEELLRQQRRAALAAMHALASFSPRLVGPVLAGNATEHSVVELHAFSDEAEAIGVALDGLGLPNRAFEQRLRVRRDQTESFPGYRFLRENVEFTVVVFPERGRGNAPLSAVDGRPVRRATAKDVEALLD